MKELVKNAQGTVAKPKVKRSAPARSDDAIKVSARDGQSYAVIEVLSTRRTRKKEVLLVLKKGRDVSAFRQELEQVVRERADISALVSTRSLEIKNLDETVEKEEGMSALCLALDRPAVDGSCRLFTRFSEVKTAMIWLTEAVSQEL